jgi:hypothetical protein
MNKTDIKQFVLEILEEYSNFPISQFSDISLFKGNVNIIDSEKNTFLLTGVSQEFSEALYELQEEEIISAIEVDNVDYILLNKNIFSTKSSDQKICYE